MIETQKLTLFLTASIILAATPGPGMLYVLSRTLAGGKREGILSSLGTFLGGMVHVVPAATGLSIVLASSAIAFSVVKYAGAGYLIYLGIRLIKNAQCDADLSSVTLTAGGSPFRQGIVTEVLNPKTALFFLSFIPQFVPKNGSHVFAGFILLGMISVNQNIQSGCCLLLAIISDMTLGCACARTIIPGSRACCKAARSLLMPATFTFPL